MILSDLAGRMRSFRFDAGVSGYCFLFILSAYLYQAVMPAFNADDIIQVQEASNDSYTFLALGRWGYFFVFNTILDANPGGIFSTLLGTLALFVSATKAATILGVQSGIARLVFVVLSCVSLYYGFLFSFDSTRLAYPVGIWLAMTGLAFLVQGKYVWACIFMALSPAFYQSAIQVAATVFVLATLYGALLGNDRGRPARFILGVAVMAASLVLYLLITKLLYNVLDVHMGSRMSVNLMSGWENRVALTNLFLESSVPFLSGHYTYYMGQRLVLPVGAIFFAFTALCVWRLSSTGRWPQWAFVAFLAFIALLAPFALAFAAADITFPPRSLIAFASLHAAWAAIAIDLLLHSEKGSSRWKELAGIGLVGLAALMALGHYMQINKKAFDDYLVSQEDLLATNRIIYRIDEVVGGSSQFSQVGPIPLAVVYKTALPAGPRGLVGTARAAPWAKEWIFRLIDKRFVVAPRAAQEKAEVLARQHGIWPAEDSVFISDGAVIVVINQ